MRVEGYFCSNLLWQKLKIIYTESGGLREINRVLFKDRGGERIEVCKYNADCGLLYFIVNPFVQSPAEVFTQFELHRWFRWDLYLVYVSDVGIENTRAGFSSGELSFMYQSVGNLLQPFKYKVVRLDEPLNPKDSTGFIRKVENCNIVIYESKQNYGFGTEEYMWSPKGRVTGIRYNNYVAVREEDDLGSVSVGKVFESSSRPCFVGLDELIAWVRVYHDRK